MTCHDQSLISCPKCAPTFQSLWMAKNWMVQEISKKGKISGVCLHYGAEIDKNRNLLLILMSYGRYGGWVYTPFANHRLQSTAAVTNRQIFSRL